MRSFKKYILLMQIIFILLLFVFSSEIFAKRSGGRSGGRSFSSRRSSSGSSYSRSSSGGKRVYVTGGQSNGSDIYYEDTNLLEDLLIYIIAGIIIFFLYFFRDLYTKKLSLYVIKISFKNDENEELIEKVLKYNKKELKIIEFEPQKMMKLVLENKNNIEIDSIDIFKDLKTSKARDLLRETKKQEDSKYKEQETLDVGEYVSISFIMNFKPELAPIHDGDNFALIEKISKLEKDDVYYMEVSIAQNITK